MLITAKPRESGFQPEFFADPQVGKTEGSHIKTVEAQRNIGFALEKVGTEGQDLYIAWVNASLKEGNPVLEDDFSDITFEKDQNAVTARHNPTQLHTDFTYGKKNPRNKSSGEVSPEDGFKNYKEAGQDRLNKYLLKHLDYWKVVLKKHDEAEVTSARISAILNPVV